MQQIIKLFWILVLSLQLNWAYAAQAQVQGLTFSSRDAGRLVFDLDAAAKYRYFTLKNPSRLVVDFENTELHGSIAQPPAGHDLVVGVRSGIRNKTNLRVVVELNANVAAHAVAVNKGQGTQLQVDLTATKEKIAKKAAGTASKSRASVDKPAKSKSVVAKEAASDKRTSRASGTKGRDIVIAIDAGHGGKDIGAQGSHGTQEKDVVLAIAKRLESAVNRQPGMKAVMIRDGDYFVKLRERVNIARKANADLFVSIHADAFDDPSAHGASVYTLANKGASSQMAQYLADSENAADIAGGAGVDAQDDVLASVLMDLSNKAGKEASQHVGNKVLKSVKSAGHLHRKNVQKAGFVVLKSPIPSILVETAFISNPEEERRLSTRAYQDKMASAVFNGIMAHFKQYAPANTRFAQLQKSGKTATRVAARKSASELSASRANDSADRVVAANKSTQTQHVISRGETLSGIARQYGVSMREIRSVNGMDDGTVKIGEVLQIPRSS